MVSSKSKITFHQKEVTRNVDIVTICRSGNIIFAFKFGRVSQKISPDIFSMF